MCSARPELTRVCRALKSEWQVSRPLPLRSRHAHIHMHTHAHAGAPQWPAQGTESFQGEAVITGLLSAPEGKAVHTQVPKGAWMAHEGDMNEGPPGEVRRGRQVKGDRRIWGGAKEAHEESGTGAEPWGDTWIWAGEDTWRGIPGEEHPAESTREEEFRTSGEQGVVHATSSEPKKGGKAMWVVLWPNFLESVASDPRPRAAWAS